MLEKILLKLLTIQTALAQFQVDLPLDGGGGGNRVFRSPSDLTPRGGIELINPLGTNNLQAILDRLIYYLLLLAAPIVAIMVIWGAFLLVTSAGNPQKIRDGWMTIVYAAVGYGVLLLAGGVSYIIQQLLLG